MATHDALERIVERLFSKSPRLRDPWYLEPETRRKGLVGAELDQAIMGFAAATGRTAVADDAGRVVITGVPPTMVH